MPPHTDAATSDNQPATKKDVRLLAAELRAEMQAMRADLLEKMNDQTRAIFVGQLASSITLGALLIAAVKL